MVLQDPLRKKGAKNGGVDGARTRDLLRDSASRMIRQLLLNHYIATKIFTLPF